jgi:hypothetical protein
MGRILLPFLRTQDGESRAIEVPHLQCRQDVRRHCGTRSRRGRLPLAAKTFDVICNPHRVAVLCVRGLTQRVEALYIANRTNFYFNFSNTRSQA